MSRLQVLNERPQTKKEIYIRQTRERCEEYWIQDDAFTPLELERIDRTWELLKKLEADQVADLGCGRGGLSRRLAERGTKVTAVDAASNAFRAQHQNITFVRECLPYLTLPDEKFDGVLLTDVVAELEPHLYRLLFSEVARLIKRGGWLLCSTPIDVHSIDALSRFLALVETEFDLLEQRTSHHRLPFRWNRKILRIAERISEILWGDGAVTHVILIAKKRPLLI